jgi:hypothetical protein
MNVTFCLVVMLPIINERPQVLLQITDLIKMTERKLQGLCHEMNIFLREYNNKLVFSVHTICCFLVDEKNKLKVLACFFEITY